MGSELFVSYTDIEIEGYELLPILCILKNSLLTILWLILLLSVISAI